MRPSPLRSGIGRGPEARERRTVIVGTVLVATAAIVVLAVLPFARRWNEREDAIAVARERVARLQAIAGREAEIAARTRAFDTELDAEGPRLVRARTPALASSALQSFVQRLARESRVSVSRLDVAGPAAAGESAALSVPVTLSAVGDIYGVADLLRRLQHGPRLLEIAELTIAPNPTLRGNLLQLSLTLRAPVVTAD